MSRFLQLFSFFFLLLNPHLAHNQHKEFIDGRIVNIKTKEPIPFATIKIKNKAIGSVSNADGGFKVPLKFKAVGDTLEISSLGYTSKEILLSQLDAAKVNIINLYEAVEKLEEVVVNANRKQKRKSAKDIIRKAMDNIPQNFPTNPFSYVGYYRDYQTKDTRYLNLNEAVLQVYDAGFGKEDFQNTQIRLYHYKENKDFPKDSIASKPYDYVNKSKIISNATLQGQGGNEYTILRFHDAIRNYNIDTYSYVNRLNKDFIKNHKFKLEADTYFDGVALYTIGISKKLDGFSMFGKIYIDKTDFSIHKLQYSVYEKNPSSNSYILYANTDIEERLLYSIIVEYQKHGNSMFPNYISFNNAFEVLKPPKFFTIAAEIEKEKKRFRLVLNNPPKEEDALQKEKYILFYLDRLLGIDHIEVNNNSILLYPKNPDVVFNREIVQYFSDRTTKGVAIQIRDVSDIYGNIINQSESDSYNQFREFFVQRVLSETKVPSDTLYMNKTIPLNENQSVTPPKNRSDYWMNTPLKTN